ncbi:MAG TPA: hypothetical protein VFP12_06330 [Allosphingosinicella sp.]|nr:hypothetical protein [Allosphingosinicella sp.]
MADEAETGSERRGKDSSKDDKWIVKGPIIMLAKAAAVVGMAGAAGVAAVVAAKRVARSLGRRTPS